MRRYTTLSRFGTWLLGLEWSLHTGDAVLDDVERAEWVRLASSGR